MKNFFTKVKWLAILLGCDAIALTISFIIFDNCLREEPAEYVRPDDYLLEDNEWDVY